MEDKWEDTVIKYSTTAEWYDTQDEIRFGYFHTTHVTFYILNSTSWLQISHLHFWSSMYLCVILAKLKQEFNVTQYFSDNCLCVVNLHSSSRDWGIGYLWKLSTFLIQADRHGGRAPLTFTFTKINDAHAQI